MGSQIPAWVARQESASRTDIVRSQQAAYQECLSRIDGLVRLKTSPGNGDGSLLSDQEYARQRTELLNERSKLEELLHDTGHRVERWLTLSEQVFEFACSARERFAKGDILTKKQILLALSSNLILKEKKLRIEAKKPFLLIENYNLAENRKNSPIEPENIGLPVGSKASSDIHFLRRLGDVEDIRTYDSLNRECVNSVYRFFQRECSPFLFKLSDWGSLTCLTGLASAWKEGVVAEGGTAAKSADSHRTGRKA